MTEEKNQKVVRVAIPTIIFLGLAGFVAYYFASFGYTLAYAQGFHPYP